MAWQTTDDVTEFLAAAGSYLREERARNTVILTVTETMRAKAEAATPPTAAAPSATAPSAAPPAGDPSARPLFGWWSDGAGTVAGAFMHSPPFPVVLTDVALDAATELAAVTMAGRPVGGVNSYPETAAAFADGWRQGNPGGRSDVHRRQRLYRLGELSWPDPAPDGTARLAGETDAPLTADWFAAFAEEVDEMGKAEDHSAAAREKISHDGVTVWEAGGEVVAIACNTVPVAGMIRIGPVYTPPKQRGHGYASAATAAVSARFVEQGVAEVLLYTDLANPVSNSIYQRIGYRPVEDRVVLAFSAQ